MKKLINSVDDFVKESLEGMKAAHGDLIDVNYDPFVVYRADAPVQGKVGVCLLYTSPSPRDRQKSRMPSSA